MNPQDIIKAFRNVAPRVDHWTLRIVIDNHESLTVRQGIVQPPQNRQSCGAHMQLFRGSSMAYAATSQLNEAGLQQAIEQGMRWLASAERHSLIDASKIPRPQQSGTYETPVEQAWHNTSLAEKIELLQAVNQQLKIHQHIVDWQAQLNYRTTQTCLLSSDGFLISQTFHYVYPGFVAVANKGAQTQVRSGGGWGTARQGGLEQLSAYDFPQAASHTAQQALSLLDARECPTGNFSLLLMPSQMMLQIHESIGHPLELDRILGDERNYAGTSFVTLDMFGEYQYGSNLLNISFDPGIPSELASYAFDDDGTPAEKQLLIQKGKLLKPLGGATSQVRSGMPGVANARACDWNRPAMDRMANLNLEPGDKTLSQLIAGVEKGVLMDTNKSWSIDDSRNKFQFGCEFGRLIEDGQLGDVVRNPNYRGISATFWRNLAAVGDSSTFEIWGTPNCGKGEPNQVIQVGHASPACVFNDIEIFGGE